jgi:hypothetical protein
MNKLNVNTYLARAVYVLFTYCVMHTIAAATYTDVCVPNTLADAVVSVFFVPIENCTTVRCWLYVGAMLFQKMLMHFDEVVIGPVRVSSCM